MTLRHILMPIFALAVLFIVLDTCPHTIQNRSVPLTVFEDLDGDGEQDRDEPPIPNTFVVAVYNVHGSFTHLGFTTDEAGQVTISAEYTHFLNLTILPPCGYRATTETTFSPDNNRRIEVGFAADAPRSGSSTVEFLLWEEEEVDGVLNPGEDPLAGHLLYVDVYGEEYHNIERNTLTMTTDAEGRATLDLGNACGTLWVRAPEWQLFADGADWMPVTYDLGTTEVALGLISE